MKKVTVLGWYGHGNCGDEAYKIAFPKVFPNYELTFTDCLKAPQVEQSDGIVLGGGNVITKDYLNMMKLAKDKRKSIISASAFSDVDMSTLVGYHNIGVRDKTSLDKILKGGQSAFYMPDLAWSFEPNPEAGYLDLRKRFKADNLEMRDSIIVVVLNTYVAVESPDRRLARDEIRFQRFVIDLARMIDNQNASFVFLPFSVKYPADDRVVNSWASAHCKFYGKNLCIFDKLTVQETLNIISASNMVLSMRLHSSIFSCVSTTPFVDITHHDKNLALLKTIDHLDWSISYWDFDAADCKRQIDRCLDDKQKIKEELVKIRDNQRKELQEVSKHVYLA